MATDSLLKLNAKKHVVSEQANICVVKYAYVTEFKKYPASTHTISNLQNGLLVQYTIIFHCMICFFVFVFVFFYQTLCKSQVVLWLHWLVMVLLYWCSEGWVSHEGLVNVFIFSLKGCEHKEGPVEPKIGPLAFNHLRIPFYPPILSSPSTPHPPPLYITNMSNITLTKNLRKTA